MPAVDYSISSSAFGRTRIEFGGIFYIASANGVACLPGGTNLNRMFFINKLHQSKMIGFGIATSTLLDAI
jgi:hypothetical protein